MGESSKSGSPIQNQHRKDQSETNANCLNSQSGFNGLDEFLTAGLLYGAHGGIGMWYNLFPKLDLGIYQAVSDGHVARAMELQGRLLAFCDLALKTTGFHPVFEHLMRERGIGPRCFRRPRGKLDVSIPESLVAELNKRVAAIEDICKE